MRGMINHSLTTHSNRSRSWMPIYQLRPQDMDILDRFWARTVLTVGADTTRALYQKESYRLGTMVSSSAPETPFVCNLPSDVWKHSFLAHLMMAVTLQHDRATSPDPSAPPSAAELFHTAQGTALYNSRLANSDSCSSSELDALWIGSAFLGVVSFAYVEARTPAEAWPLQPRPASEPHWMTIGDGKKEVWRISDLTRQDSSLTKFVQPVVDVFVTVSATPTRGELCNIPPEIVQFLELDNPETQQSNPRFGPAIALSRLMPLEYNSTTILKFVLFHMQMEPEFRDLLDMKDPGAMLLLAYWYAKVSKYQQWWTWRRAILECQAICIYLRRYHPDLPHLGVALRYPESVCGGFGGITVHGRQLQ